MGDGNANPGNDLIDYSRCPTITITNNVLVIHAGYQTQQRTTDQRIEGCMLEVNADKQESSIKERNEIVFRRKNPIGIPGSEIFESQ